MALLPKLNEKRKALSGEEGAFIQETSVAESPERHEMKNSDDTNTMFVTVGGFEVTPRATDYVNQALASNRLSYGPFSRKFETHFAALHNAQFAILCNSGTSALHMALACLKELGGWQDDDEVIVPAVTFVATSNMVLLNNLTPVFVDVDAKTYNIDPQKIEEKITPKTRAIMPVHLFGQPCEMDPIMKIARHHNLKVIEDSAETVLARYKGKPVGSWGDISAFSTYVAHLVVTGAGGLAVTNNPDYAVVLKSLLNHGRDSIYLNIDDRGTTSVEFLEIVEARFRFVRFGHSFRATELEAALGLAQLEEIDGLMDRRKANAAFLLQGLKQFSPFLQLPSWPEYSEHAFMMFPLVIRDRAVAKKELIGFLEEKGIETRDMLPLLNQPIYKQRFGDIEQYYPVAQWINANGFYIGCHPYLHPEQLDYVIAQFEQFFQRAA